MLRLTEAHVHRDSQSQTTLGEQKTCKVRTDLAEELSFYSFPRLAPPYLDLQFYPLGVVNFSSLLGHKD